MSLRFVGLVDDVAWVLLSAVHGFQGGPIGAVKARNRIRRVRKRDAVGHGHVTVARLPDGREGLQNHLLQIVTGG